MKGHFNGQLETCVKLKRVTTKEQLVAFLEYQAWVESRNKEGGVGDPSKQHGVKWCNVLNDLPP
jgi:hypothetical protein